MKLSGWVNKKISLGLLFIIGAVLGALCFVGIYGVKVLDFTNTGWLFFGDTDLRQHYIAWCHFRQDPWHFPIGLIDSLSYPNSMSVIYTDSIPLFAIPFKLFRNLLPVTFQYFGLFGILSFMLMGGFSAILLRRFIDSDVISLMGSIFYIIGFPVIQRMFYHTALASQWIIIACLVLWVYDDVIKSKVRKCVYWALIGFLCVAIHSYFLPMCGMILAALMICQYISGDKLLPIFEFLSFCAVGLINLFVLGGFYGGTNASGAGLGTFGSNLNTFVNPLDMGKILPRLPVYYDFQYEGMAYLGVGILFLLAVIAVALIIIRCRKITIGSFHTKKIYPRLTIGLIIVSFLSASLPLLAFGNIKIIQIPYPEFVNSILGVFRSNGRLVWVAYYLIVTVAITFFVHILKGAGPYCITLLIVALMWQVTDLSETVIAKHDYFTSEYIVETMWEEPPLSAMCEGKEEIAFLYNDNDITMMTAYYGYLSGMRQNNYYFARDIDDKVNASIEKYFAELKKGYLREDTVYVLREEDYVNNRKLFESLPADYELINSHVVFILAESEDSGTKDPSEEKAE